MDHMFLEGVGRGMLECNLIYMRLDPLQTIKKNLRVFLKSSFAFLCVQDGLGVRKEADA